MRALSLATIFAALSGFVVVIVASWALPETINADFQAYWGLFFALAGLIDGITQETTRATSAVRAGASPRSARPVRLAGVVALIAGISILATGGVWMGFLLHHPHPAAIALFAIGLSSYVFQALLSGVLSGLKHWGAYAWLVAIDSGVRMLAAACAWWQGWGIGAFLLITVMGAATWLLIIAFSPQARAALQAPVDVTSAAYRRGVVSAMAATGASAALITGFPPLVRITHGTGDSSVDGVSVAAIIMAVLLTRAPILVPTQRFQSALVVYFVDRRERLLSALLIPLAVVGAVGVAGAGLAWLFGPWILGLFLPASYVLPSWLLAVLTFASACTGSLMITGCAALSHERHSVYVLGWVVATASAFGVLLLPFSLTTAVCAALILGPLIGMAVHVYSLLGAHVRRVH
ncbi:MULTISPECIES: hypothetical protein [Corynebacterium]|uniref:hypothetical protein n=1 Tax=Corynebacterium TaxID=1716 RepID=UPI00124E89A1|nr:MULTISPECIES: hypothetical protein [Corynebacterium]